MQTEDDNLDRKVDLAALIALTALFLVFLKDCQAEGEPLVVALRKSRLRLERMFLRSAVNQGAWRLPH